MKKPQLLLVIGAVALLAGLYWGGRTVPNEHNHSHESHTNTVRLITTEQILAAAKQQLNPAQAQALSSLASKQDTASLRAISKVYASAKQASASAKFNADAAKLENTEKSLTFASQYFIDLYSIEQDTAIAKWQAKQAIELLQKALQLNPSNEAATVALAQCYTDGTGETMKGVMMLRGVAEKNPKNLQAGISLGRLAIKSGQFDKALARLQALAAVYPRNSEVLYHLAEAYKSTGNTAKAKELLNECKKIVKNPNFSKEIDDYIKTF